MKKESVIQQEIVAYLSSIAQQYNFVFFAVPNEGFMAGAKRNMPAEQRYALSMNLKKMGLTPGIPDLCLLHEGRAYMFEVKRPGEKLTDRQYTLIGILNYKIKIPVVVVCSVEDVEIALNEFGIIK